MKLDLLAFAPHPDDAELYCSGTIVAHVAAGYKCGVIDLTTGEMGTRGTPEIRIREAEESAKILGLHVRENLGFEDVKFLNDWEHQMKVVKLIRKYRPEVVLAPAVSDRHPDHEKAAELVKQACFKAGLQKLETVLDDHSQEAFRPKRIFHYIQNDYIEPDLIVDITGFWEVKYKSIMTFRSQFYNPESHEPETFISSKEFMEFIEARARVFGHRIGAQHGEGFTISTTPGVKNLFTIV